VTHHGILMTRLVAACFGTLAVFAFFAIIRPWYGLRVAFVSTLLFATSAGFLHTTRLGTAQILQVSVLAFVAAVLWYRREQNHRVLAGYGIAALLALLWYVPGIVWFEFFGVMLLWYGLQRQLLRTPRVHVAGWGIVFAVVIAPLVLASLRSPHLLLVAAGLPQSIHALIHIAGNALNAVMSIGVRSNGNPLFWVGHAPLFDAAELVLGVIGAYFYLYRQHSVRAIFLIGSVGISLVLISLGGSVGFASLVPLLYLLVAHGLDHLLGQWLTVFPRNPIARSTGTAILCAMLFFSVLYQVRSYFVAWPHDTATRQTFRLTQP
jgi:hypothetical protein